MEEEVKINEKDLWNGYKIMIYVIFFLLGILVGYLLVNSDVVKCQQLLGEFEKNCLCTLKFI